MQGDWQMSHRMDSESCDIRIDLAPARFSRAFNLVAMAAACLISCGTPAPSDSQGSVLHDDGSAGAYGDAARAPDDSGSATKTSDASVPAESGPGGGGDGSHAEAGAPIDASERDAGYADVGSDSYKADAQVDAARSDSGVDAGEADAELDSGRIETGSDASADGASPDAPSAQDAADAESMPCELGGSGRASDEAGTRTAVSGYGSVNVNVASNNQVVALVTTMTVPPEPPAGSGTLFLWPGIQPLTGGANFDVLNNGVLQPVLTWGGTCAPTAPEQSYASWWISGQYVNTYITSSSPNYASYNGCHGGTGMTVGVGDQLAITMRLQGTTWTQSVFDPRTGLSATYSIDMLG